MVMVTNVMEVVTDKEVQQFDKNLCSGPGGGGGAVSDTTRISMEELVPGF